MAPPVKYWMLVCQTCQTPRVVLDTELEYVGSSEPNPPPGSGYGGRFISERYSCTHCGGISMKTHGSMWDVNAQVYEPGLDSIDEVSRSIQLSSIQRAQWHALIIAAGLPWR